MKAILYKTKTAWVLEPVTGCARTFITAAAARAWALTKSVRVIRTPNCDE